jgi:DNA-binding MarR family transcriptional regulator/predicted GNAT family N-acyltransferase
MTDFFEKAGKMAIGSRLRMLTEQITNDAAEIYKLFEVDLQPKWFPVFYVLSENEGKTITTIAKEIGHSHASVSKIISEMLKKQIVKEIKNKEDKRQTVIILSEKGKIMKEKFEYQVKDVSTAIEDILSQTRYDLWKAIEEWEFLLEQKPLYRRVLEQKKHRESQKVQIVDYAPQYRKAFRDLNEEWISKYFVMEEADYKALDNPEGYILNKGGAILVALYEGEPVGVCALIKMEDPEYDYELAKMAVSPKVQGKNIGFLLGEAIKNKTKQLGGKKLFLESNTILKPAINLYHKLGFIKVIGHSSPYERSNIQMGLDLIDIQK